jgi:hypothetical protein
MTKRRYVPRKKLGSKRIDLPLTKKKEYLRRIITLKQPYNEVRKIYMKEFGKDLPHNTFRNWRKNGAAILDADFRGVNCRACTKKADIIDKFEQMVMDIVENSKHDIEGVPGLTLECMKLQKTDEFKNEEEVQNLKFSPNYVHRLLRRFLAKITRASTSQIQQTPEERQLEDARLMSIMAPFLAEDIYNSDEVHF